MQPIKYMNLISEIQTTPVRPQNGLVGFASFVYSNSFHFSSIGIYTRLEGGYRLTYPTRKSLSGSSNIFYPINKTIAQKIEDEVIAKFEEVTKKYVRHNRPDFE